MTANASLAWVLFIAAGILLSGKGALRADDPPAETKGPHAEEIAKADNDFCRLSLSDGAVKSFDRYMAAESIDPMASSPTAVAKPEMLARLKKLDDAGLVLSWHPRRAETASSGDFGYTYGPWELRKKADGELTGRGYYATVWKKVNGDWKAIFDMGNESPLEAR